MRCPPVKNKRAEDFSSASLRLVTAHLADATLLQRRLFRKVGLTEFGWEDCLQSGRLCGRAHQSIKNKKAEDFSSASLRLVPSPRYFAKPNLLQGRDGGVAGRDRSRAVAHDSIRERAEVTHTRLVRGQR